MIPNDNTDNEARDASRELGIAMGIIGGFIALAFITVALWP